MAFQACFRGLGSSSYILLRSRYFPSIVVGPEGYIGVLLGGRGTAWHGLYYGSLLGILTGLSRSTDHPRTFEYTHLERLWATLFQELATFGLGYLAFHLNTINKDHKALNRGTLGERPPFCMKPCGKEPPPQPRRLQRCTSACRASTSPQLRIIPQITRSPYST